MKLIKTKAPGDPVRATVPTIPKSARAVTTNEGGRNADDASFCVRHALPEEWAAFRAKVAERVAVELPIMRRCNKCGAVSWRPFRSSPGAPCVRCNINRYENGGRMTDMPPKEIREHKAAEAARDVAVCERMRKAREYSDNQSRLRQGLDPLPAAKGK